MSTPAGPTCRINDKGSCGLLSHRPWPPPFEPPPLEREPELDPDPELLPGLWGPDSDPIPGEVACPEFPGIIPRSKSPALMP